MDWSLVFLGTLFFFGVVLAFPLAILICALLGGVLMAYDRLTTRCPVCQARKMKRINAIRETYPTGEGTGSFYLCSACGRRSFWSNDDNAWEDATANHFDHFYS